MSYTRGMEFFLIVLAVLVVLKILFPPTYRVTILYRPDEPAVPELKDTGKPLTVDPEALRQMPGQAQADLFRVISKDHLRRIEAAMASRQPRKARELIASLKRQFPDAEFDGMEEVEQRLQDMEKWWKW